MKRKDFIRTGLLGTGIFAVLESLLAAPSQQIKKTSRVNLAFQNFRLMSENGLE